MLLYFALIGWLCELKISECHEPILVKALRSPWKILTCFFEKIKAFFSKPLLSACES